MGLWGGAGAGARARVGGRVECEVMNECTNAPFRSRCRDCWERQRQERQGDEHGVMVIESFGAGGRNTHVIESKKVVCAKRTDDAHL